MNQIEKIEDACKKAAEELNIEPSDFKRQVFDIVQKEYDKEDIESWLDEEGYEYTEADIEKILGHLRNNWSGTWDNISRAYYASGLCLRR